MNFHQYIELRNLTLCRLILCNAHRRGGETNPSLHKTLERGRKWSLLDQQNLGQLDPLDTAIADTLKITYQTGEKMH